MLANIEDRVAGVESRIDAERHTKISHIGAHAWESMSSGILQLPLAPTTTYCARPPSYVPPLKLSRYLPIVYPNEVLHVFWC